MPGYHSRLPRLGDVALWPDHRRAGAGFLVTRGGGGRFFDFAGYPHSVIGAARLFGVELAENFNSPFIASTPSEFWTRWHMTLTSWIRDYVFVPMATLRRDVWWRYAAVVRCYGTIRDRCFINPS